jgi:hypothetical protein
MIPSIAGKRNTLSKRKITCAQIDILNELDLKGIWGGGSQLLRIFVLF